MGGCAGESPPSPRRWSCPPRCSTCPRTSRRELRAPVRPGATIARLRLSKYEQGGGEGTTQRTPQKLACPKIKLKNKQSQVKKKKKKKTQGKKKKKKKKKS